MAVVIIDFWSAACEKIEMETSEKSFWLYLHLWWLHLHMEHLRVSSRWKILHTALEINSNLKEYIYTDVRWSIAISIPFSHNIPRELTFFGVLYLNHLKNTSKPICDLRRKWKTLTTKEKV